MRSPSTTGTTTLDTWIERTHSVEQVLEKTGRADLTVLVITVREILIDAKHDPRERDATLALVARVLREVRACVVEPDRTPSADILAALERLREPPRAPAPTTPAPFDPRAAEEMLSGLGHLEDGSLNGLLAALDVAPAKPADGLGTMRGVRVDSGAEHRVLMKGELHPGLLTDLIQLFAQNMETGRLALQDRETQKIASLFFRDGQIVDAVMDDRVGEDAFLLAVGIREGLFTYQRGVAGSATRITRPTRHLVFEALKVLDETPGLPGATPNLHDRKD